MSKIEELIKKHCPDGVEYVKFVDYANVLYGCPFDASKFTDDKSFIPLIRIRDVLSGKAGTYYTGEFSKEYIIKKGDVLVGMDGNFNLGVWDDIDGLLCQRVCKLYTKDENKLLNGYIRHYMKPVFRQIEESTAGGSVKHLSARAINAIEIPLPPLPVQEEIVRILDNFTTLEAELEAELEARQQQYQYYRDNLLSFEGRTDVEWKKLGEICNVITGGEVPQNSIKGDIPKEEMKYPIWGNGKDVYGFSKTYQIGQDAVCISSIGANTGAIFYHQAFFTPIIRLKVLIPKDKTISARYLFYVLSVIGFDVKKSSVPNMNSNEVKQKLVPVPPLTEQERIVSILDRFDTLVNDISQGLPAEIAARRKQYEYYRDKLLTFKEKTA